MGELLLCNEPVAAVPYYIEGVSLNIYSLEELCYYISHNAYLIDRNFMDPELCDWMEKELKLAEFAGQLREQISQSGRLSDFVNAIMEKCGYCTRAEIAHVYRVLQELEGKSDFECGKIRADRLMQKEKYISSIYEYRRLLDSDEAAGEDAVTVGNIWHNLGTAYARMFLFEEAERCYEKAYRCNLNEESLRERMFAFGCLHDEDRFIREAVEECLSPETVQKIREEIAEARQSAQEKMFDGRREELEELLRSGKRAQYHQAISGMILKWKEDYRRICRV